MPLSAGPSALSPALGPRQVYSFGGVSVVLDNTQNLIRALLPPRWVPVSLERLVEEARKRQRGQ